MRFAPESLHGANNGLSVARSVLEGVKKDFPWISYGDLWTLAGVAAIQVCPRRRTLQRSELTASVGS
jgi:cytochrome c peroxidase